MEYIKTTNCIKIMSIIKQQPIYNKDKNWPIE